MTTWVAWVVFAGVGAALGLAGYHFSLRTVRVAAAVAAVALVVTVTAYGLRHPAPAPAPAAAATATATATASLAGAFTRGADGIASAFFAPLWPGRGVPPPGRDGWIVIGVAIVAGYRELEAWALHWQAPVLDTSRLGDGQPGDGQFAAQLKFRLAAIQVRSPSILPGGSRTSALASVAEDSGVTGGGLAGAVIRFAGALWPSPRRLQIQVWAEPGSGKQGVRVTVELEDTGDGATVATKTVAAASQQAAASMVAGYAARQVFERDPATPPWCYGASDGRDLGMLQLARQERVDVTGAADMAASRAGQIAILRAVTGGDRCAGLARYELAQLLNLGEDHLGALVLHAANRERYPRFFRGRYRLAMSLEMIANSGFVFPGRHAAADALGQALERLTRCGAIKAGAVPADWFTRREAGWSLSAGLNAVLLEVARAELRTLRRRLALPAVAWAMLARRDERATWKPYLRLRVRQGFRDGTDAGLLLVAVRQRLNDASARQPRCARALRIAAAVTGDSEPVLAVLRRPRERWRLTGGPPAGARDRVRWLPWQRRTASWQAAYGVACLHSALASYGQGGLAREDRIVASLRRAIGNRDCEMERPHDWISHDPDFRLQITDPGRYPAFTAFLRDTERMDYPGTRDAASTQRGGWRRGPRRSRSGRRLPRARSR